MVPTTCWLSHSTVWRRESSVSAGAGPEAVAESQPRSTAARSWLREPKNAGEVVQEIDDRGRPADARLQVGDGPLARDVVEQVMLQEGPDRLSPRPVLGAVEEVEVAPLFRAHPGRQQGPAGVVDVEQHAVA